MRNPKQLWHVFSHASVVVELWHVMQFVAGPVVALMTFMAAVGQDLPLAYVIAATVVALGGAVWTINQLGILFGKPLVVRFLEDYSYGISYEGLVIAFDAENIDAALQISVKIANTSPGPLRYKVERFDVVVGNRTLAQKTFLTEGALLPLSAHSQYRYPPFSRDDIKDFIGKRPNGSVEFHIAYGHPDHNFVRRLKMKLDVFLRMDKGHGIADLIREQTDEPIF